MRRKRKATVRDGIIHTYRKTFKVGHSLVIPLPPEWIKEHGIQPGDDFAITANNIVSLVKRPKSDT